MKEFGNVALKGCIYARKSSESEERQVQSIDDQVRLMREKGIQEDIPLMYTLTESKSAKDPNQREKFNELVSLVNEGEVNVILCWHVNRLARNPLESGLIQQLLIDEKILAIVTHARTFTVGDNAIFFSVEAAQAAQYSRELSTNVKRGQKSKIEKGNYPGRAPMGYMNDKNLRRIVPDPDRFTIVREMWDWALTGNYSPRQIVKKANGAGFTSLQYGRLGGTRLSRSGIYKMFSNPFYIGQMEWAGNVYPGNHEPMVSIEEFERVAEIFGRSNRPRGSKMRHPYNGLIECDCGCMITTEEKIKTFRTTGKTCIYKYGKCTKRKKGVTCDARPIRIEDLEKQVLTELESVAIDKDFLNWAFETLDENANMMSEVRYRSEAMKKETIADIRKEIELAKRLYLRGITPEDEFISEKQRYDREIALLEAKERRAADFTKRRDDLKEQLKFMSEAKKKLELGSDEEKHSVLAHFGQNHRLSKGKFTLSLCHWAEKVRTGYKSIENQYKRLELQNNIEKSRQNANLEAIRLAWCGQG